MVIALGKEEILQELSNKRDRLAEFGVEEIGLFGSFYVVKIMRTAILIYL